MNIKIEDIFNIASEKEFSDMALALFRYQADECEVYSNFLDGLKIKMSEIKELNQIPFLPIDLFKSYVVKSKTELELSNPKVFESSGTTGVSPSKHFVYDVSIYEKSYLKCFELFYGNITEYCILALLPSYHDRNNSSLIYMINDLIKRTQHSDSGYYLNNQDELISKLKQLENQNQKAILIGVSYALLDLIEKHSPLEIGLSGLSKNLIVMETGGMKGKRKEMVREELHKFFYRGFGLKAIHSEYGMTELLSQAYSKGDGIFFCPPWMRVLIRDINDPLTILTKNKTGGINVIDLANINSCSFIATQDLGKLFSDNSFEVLGRFDNSDVRGCNLMID